MYESDPKIVDSLRNSSTEFNSLFKQHAHLKERVRKAELGMAPVDDQRLSAMKREKLHCKDLMAAMIADYQRAHPVA